jgi:hypothetical protein
MMLPQMRTSASRRRGGNLSAVFLLAALCLSPTPPLRFTRVLGSGSGQDFAKGTPGALRGYKKSASAPAAPATPLGIDTKTADHNALFAAMFSASKEKYENRGISTPHTQKKPPRLERPKSFGDQEAMMGTNRGNFNSAQPRLPRQRSLSDKHVSNEREQTATKSKPMINRQASQSTVTQEGFTAALSSALNTADGSAGCGHDGYKPNCGCERSTAAQQPA